MGSREEREHPLVMAARRSVEATLRAEQRLRAAQAEYESANRIAARALADMSTAGFRENWGDHWIMNLRVLPGDEDVLAEHRERLRQEYIAADQVRKAAPPVSPLPPESLGKGMKCPNCGRLYLTDAWQDDDGRPVCVECEAEPGHPTSVAVPVSQFSWNYPLRIVHRITKPRFLLIAVEG
jgi:hypothetical protein